MKANSSYILYKTFKVERISKVRTPVFFTSILAAHKFQLKQYKELGVWEEVEPVNVPHSKKRICEFLNNLNNGVHL